MGCVGRSCANVSMLLEPSAVPRIRLAVMDEHFPNRDRLL